MGWASRTFPSLKAFPSLHYGPSRPGWSRAWLKNFMFFCRTLASFKILSKSAVLLLWTALKESASNVQLCASAKHEAAETCAQCALATAGIAASCCLGEAYPRWKQGETQISPYCTVHLQSSSGASFTVFLCHGLCHLQLTTHRVRASYARTRCLVAGEGSWGPSKGQSRAEAEECRQQVDGEGKVQIQRNVRADRQ